VNGVRTIAAPVFRGRAPVAAMAVIATTASVPEGGEGPVAEALLRTTRAVSAELGRDTADAG
jgi:DNA-binding IclR family transcriptional regulator